MRTYIITKAADGRHKSRQWHVSVTVDKPGWIGMAPVVCGSYKSRKAAVVSARLLGGHNATVVICN